MAKRASQPGASWELVRETIGKRTEHVLERDHAAGKLRHRQAEEEPRAERREVDLHAALLALVFGAGEPVVEPGDEAAMHAGGRRASRSIVSPARS